MRRTLVCSSRYQGGRRSKKCVAPRSRLKYSNTVDALGKQRIRFMPQRHPDADTTCVFYLKKAVCTIQKKLQREHVAQRCTPSSLCGSLLFNFYFYFFWHLPVLLANSLRRNAAEEQLFVAEGAQRRRFGGRAAASAAACAEVGDDSGALLRARQVASALLRTQTVGEGVGLFGGAVEFAHLLEVERGNRQLEADAVRA